MLVGARPQAELLAIVHEGQAGAPAPPRPQVVEGGGRLGERDQIPQPFADREHRDLGALLLGHVVAGELRRVHAREREVAVVHQHELDAGVGERPRQVGFPHALGEPHPARAHAEVTLQELGEVLDLTDLVVVGEHRQDRLVKAPGQQLDLAARRERAEQIERPRRTVAEEFQERARAVHRQANRGERPRQLQKRLVRALDRVSHDVVEVPRRLVIVDAEQERHAWFTHGRCPGAPPSARVRALP